MKKRIYLVDDDQDIIEQNKLVLESNGYEVVTASSAKEGEQLLSNGSPDLMVLDVMMEYGNAGLELARKIAKNDDIERFPIILLTSDSNNPNWLNQDGATWNNIKKYLDKPVTPEMLLKTIKDIVG